MSFIQTLKPDRSEMDDDSKIGPVNLDLHSLFETLETFLNGPDNIRWNSSYPYQSYLDTLLSD